MAPRRGDLYEFKNFVIYVNDLDEFERRACGEPRQRLVHSVSAELLLLVATGDERYIWAGDPGGEKTQRFCSFLYCDKLVWVPTAVLNDRGTICST